MVTFDSIRALLDHALSSELRSPVLVLRVWWMILASWNLANGAYCFSCAAVHKSPDSRSETRFGEVLGALHVDHVVEFFLSVKGVVGTEMDDGCHSADPPVK